MLSSFTNYSSQEAEVQTLSRPFARLKYESRQGCKTRQVQTEENQWNTYMNQSTEKMSAMSSVGNPAACNTITVVTSPALGMAAAPMDAPAAVSLTGEVKSKR